MDRRLWWAAALAALLALAVADALTTASIAGSFAVVPLLAAGGCRLRVTVAFAAVATAAAAVSSVVQHGGAFAGSARIVTVAVAGVAGCVLSAQLSRSAERLTAARRVAEVAQYAVLTPVPAAVGPFALASAYVSASQDALIGGDLYGVVQSPFGLRVIVGDVRGKGLDAVELAAITLTTFRELAGTAVDLVDIATSLDARIRPRLDHEDFVTAVIACLSDDGTVDLVNCGHPPPVILHGGSFHPVDTDHPSAPLGLDPDPTGQQLRLNAGDRLLFYTDGLIEARAHGGGFVDRDQVLHGAGEAPLDAALAGVLRRLREASGDSHRDDLALLLVEYAPPVPEVITLTDHDGAPADDPTTAA